MFNTGVHAGILQGTEGRQYYQYTEDLLLLEALSPLPKQCEASPIEGFLPLQAWIPFLDSHPDKRFAEFLRRGITNGFRIGFNRGKLLKQCPKNLKSVSEYGEEVDTYIRSEVANGKLVALQPTLPTAGHISPIGIIPKAHQPGKFRLIVDLSAPKGNSVNDGVPPDLCSLEYTSVDEAAQLVKMCGKGAWMAKIDLQSAYRMVPIHPYDQPLLAITWRQVTYIDQAQSPIWPQVSPKSLHSSSRRTDLGSHPIGSIYPATLLG